MITQSHQASASKGGYNKDLLNKIRTKMDKKTSNTWKAVKLGRANSSETLRTENEP